MTTADDLTVTTIRLARRLADELHDDDIAERWWARTIELPDGVRIGFETMGNNPERVRSIFFGGEFVVEALRGAAAAEEHLVESDVWSLTFPAIEGVAPSRGATIVTFAAEGPTDRFKILPDDQPAPTPPPTPPTPDVIAARQPATASGRSGQARLGDLVATEPFDETRMLADHIVEQLAVLRSGRHDVEMLLGVRPLDDATAMFGAAPGFLAVLALGVDGAVIGHMVDAEELGRLHHRLVLHEPNTAGVGPTDDSFVLTTLLGRLVNNRSQTTTDPAGLAALAEDLGVEMSDGTPDLQYEYGVTRARPLVAPKGWKWRNDSSGNGVLARPDTWGSTTVRKPTSVDRSLTLATDLTTEAPAAALYCAHEALALANRANDPEAVRTAYGAMVAPLRSLDRPRVAARAASLAAS